MLFRLSMVFAIGLAACGTRPDKATGELGAWQTGPALPIARANQCAAAIDNLILVIGGNRAVGTGFMSTDEIDVAQIDADGNLSGWQVAGHTAGPVSECDAATDGNHLYVIGGIYEDTTLEGQIWTADLDSNGQLGTMTSVAALPMNVDAISTGATMHDGTLLVTDSSLVDDQGNGSDDTFVVRTPIKTTSWTTDDLHIDSRFDVQYAFTDKFVYVMGGYHDPQVGAIADVYVAPIGASGAVGSAVMTAPLPAAVASGDSAVVDDWIFVAGGGPTIFTGGGTTAVYAAQIGSDGKLAAWTTPTALSMPRTHHSLTLVDDFLVLTGGAATGPGDTTVLVSRVRYPQ